ncbi:MAG: 2-oxo acid dehydrogenase subunit E2 [Ignavibacteria bacterium]|jgi:pyruvate/2-oxoglutarate dehydrogenase complex dihydrolipoamide acyltransferase (E2) component|nr:2-oxo acid dehydrogenase subunit E2 [Ignavibacteria bacterium]
MTEYSIREFPATRIATIDVGAIGKEKHHMYALIECDVTESRLKIKSLKLQGSRISFTGWLLKAVSLALKEHSEAAAFLYGKKKKIIFEDINVSLLVEKTLQGTKVPIPLVIEQADRKSIQDITKEIESAKEEVLSGSSIVINRKTSLSERLYYHLPGYLRRAVWRLMLRHPRSVYKKMGNVSFTSIGMFGQIKGWFIHTSIHPVSFGISSVIKKPVVINDEIRIREILNMTVLLDHDVIDGGPMVRFISDLVKAIECGRGL